MGLIVRPKDNSVVQSLPREVGLWPKRREGWVQHMALIRQARWREVSKVGWSSGR